MEPDGSKNRRANTTKNKLVATVVVEGCNNSLQ